MKTIYISAGETAYYDTLTAEHIVVNGCLKTDGAIRAKRIDGNGVIFADSIYADGLCIGGAETSKIVCERLLAKYIEADDVIASESALISCSCSAARLKTGKLTVAANDIGELVSDEVTYIRPRKRGLVLAMITSAVRSLLAYIKLRPEASNAPMYERRTQAQRLEPELKAEIVKAVREAMEAFCADMVQEPLEGAERGSDFRLEDEPPRCSAA